MDLALGRKVILGEESLVSTTFPGLCASITETCSFTIPAGALRTPLRFGRGFSSPKVRALRLLRKIRGCFESSLSSNDDGVACK